MIKSALAALVILMTAPVATAEPIVDVSHLLMPLHFSLRDDDGRAVSEQSFRSDIVLVYFGYSGCGDQCPLTLTRLARLMTQLGPDAAKVRVLFVTVTPQTDTPAVLKAYLSGYGAAHMTGLTGGTTQLRGLAHHLRAAFPVLSTDPPVHSGAVYVFDTDGRAVAIVPPDASDGALKALVLRLCHERR